MSRLSYNESRDGMGGKVVEENTGTDVGADVGADVGDGGNVEDGPIESTSMESSRALPQNTEKSPNINRRTTRKRESAAAGRVSPGSTGSAASLSSYALMGLPDEEGDEDEDAGGEDDNGADVASSPRKSLKEGRKPDKTKQRNKRKTSPDNDDETTGSAPVPDPPADSGSTDAENSSSPSSEPVANGRPESKEEHREPPPPRPAAAASDDGSTDDSKNKRKKPADDKIKKAKKQKRGQESNGEQEEEQEMDEQQAQSKQGGSGDKGSLGDTGGGVSSAGSSAPTAGISAAADSANAGNVVDLTGSGSEKGVRVAAAAPATPGASRAHKKNKTNGGTDGDGGISGKVVGTPAAAAGGGAAAESDEDGVVMLIGKSPSEGIKKLASARLSSWARKFTEPRAFVAPAVPVIEPINDDYLTGFGRAYSEAKSRSAGSSQTGGKKKGKGKGKSDKPKDGNKKVAPVDTLKSGEETSTPEEGKEGGSAEEGQQQDQSSVPQEQATLQDSGADGGSKDDYSVPKTSAQQEKQKEEQEEDDDDDDDDVGEGESSSDSDVSDSDSDDNMLAAPVGGSDESARAAAGLGSPAGGVGRAALKHGVYILNLAYEICTEKQLKHFFTKYGKVTHVAFVPGKRGNAKLYFAKAEQAAAAISDTGRKIAERSIYIRQLFTGALPSRYFVDPDDRANKAPVKQETASSPGTLCTFCGAPGHVNKDCPSVCCSECFQQGHTSDRCSVPASKTDAVAVCSICGAWGHDSSVCPDIDNERAEEGFSCMNCRDAGHMSCGPDMQLMFGIEALSGTELSSCWNCGMTNHLPNELCPEPNQDQIFKRLGYVSGNPTAPGGRRNSNSAKCHFCNQVGHMIAKCPVQRAQRQERRNGGKQGGLLRRAVSHPPSATWPPEDNGARSQPQQQFLQSPLQIGQSPQHFQHSSQQYQQTPPPQPQFQLPPHLLPPSPHRHQAYGTLAYHGATPPPPPPPPPPPLSLTSATLPFSPGGAERQSGMPLSRAQTYPGASYNRGGGSLRNGGASGGGDSGAYQSPSYSSRNGNRHDDHHYGDHSNTPRRVFFVGNDRSGRNDQYDRSVYHSGGGGGRRHHSDERGGESARYDSDRSGRGSNNRDRRESYPGRSNEGTRSSGYSGKNKRSSWNGSWVRSDGGGSRSYGR